MHSIQMLSDNDIPNLLPPLLHLSSVFFLSRGRKKECKIGMLVHNFTQKNVKEVPSLTFKGWCLGVS